MKNKRKENKENQDSPILISYLIRNGEKKKKKEKYSN